MSSKNNRKEAGGGEEKKRDKSQSEIVRRTGKRPFINCFLAKADRINQLSADMCVAATKKGVPGTTLQQVQAFATMSETFQQAIQALKDSGWVPSNLSKMELSENDTITIASDKLALYSYIPDIWMNRLVVSKVLKQGKKVQILVSTDDGTPCGYIPRSHLVVRQ